MARIKILPGLNISLVQGDDSFDTMAPMEEYEPPLKAENQAHDPDTSVKYVKSIAGNKYAIKVQLSRMPASLHAQFDLKLIFFIDGVHVRNMVIRKCSNPSGMGYTNRWVDVGYVKPGTGPRGGGAQEKVLQFKEIEFGEYLL
jgi:hypothetical protein